MTSLGYELIVISACVLGGGFLKGGLGKVSYVVASVLISGAVESAMNLLSTFHLLHSVWFAAESF